MGKIILANDAIVLEEKKEEINQRTENLKKDNDEFANAFPEWSLVPPSVLIKRVRRTI